MNRPAQNICYHLRVTDLEVVQEDRHQVEVDKHQAEEGKHQAEGSLLLGEGKHRAVEGTSQVVVGRCLAEAGIQGSSLLLDIKNRNFNKK